MSPTASMPNFLVNGKSPHLPSRSTGKKQACGWPIQWKKRVKPDENLPKKTPKTTHFRDVWIKRDEIGSLEID
mgnify:CR=1 FL=1